MEKSVEFFKSVKADFEAFTKVRTPKVGLMKSGLDPILISEDADIPKTLFTEEQLRIMSRIEEDLLSISKRIQRNGNGQDKKKVDIFDNFLNFKRYKNRLLKRSNQARMIVEKYEEAINKMEDLIGKIVSKFDASSTVTFLRDRISSENSADVTRPRGSSWQA